jgi:hypothetical protein
MKDNPASLAEAGAGGTDGAWLSTADWRNAKRTRAQAKASLRLRKKGLGDMLKK